MNSIPTEGNEKVSFEDNQTQFKMSKLDKPDPSCGISIIDDLTKTCF